MTKSEVLVPMLLLLSSCVEPGELSVDCGVVEGVSFAPGQSGGGIGFGGGGLIFMSGGTADKYAVVVKTRTKRHIFEGKQLWEEAQVGDTVRVYYDLGGRALDQYHGEYAPAVDPACQPMPARTRE